MKANAVPDFVARALREEMELHTKTEALKSFIESDSFDHLAKQHRNLQVAQYEYMKGYLYTLRCRIRLLAIEFGFEFKK